MTTLLYLGDVVEDVCLVIFLDEDLLLLFELEEDLLIGELLSEFPPVITFPS
jgi:hypothetical protein